MYSSREVREIRRDPNRVLLEAKGKGRAFLASSEAAYPGWKIRTGEGKRAMVRVNHDFRGVALAEGETRVETVFEPVTVRLGLFLSLLACGVWVPAVLGVLRRRGHA
jgi:hypothetical protein